jgi:hypothetical protein
VAVAPARHQRTPRRRLPAHPRDVGSQDVIAARRDGPVVVTRRPRARRPARPGEGRPAGSRWWTVRASSAAAARSISVSVVQRPRERRIAASAESSVTFIARSTGDGSWRPAWQADPVDAATVGQSASSWWPRVPAMLRLRVFGSRCWGCPLSRTRPAAVRPACGATGPAVSPAGPGHRERVPARRVRRPRRGRPRGRRFGAGTQAASLTAAGEQRAELNARADVEGSDAFGGVHLVPDHGEQVDAAGCHVDRGLADGLRPAARRSGAAPTGFR